MLFFFADFSKYWWFQTKQVTWFLEFIKLYKQNQLEIFFSPYYLPKLYFGINVVLLLLIIVIYQSLTQFIHMYLYQ